MSATIWTDEGLALAVVWNGGATFNVHVYGPVTAFRYGMGEGTFGVEHVVGREVDVFTVYGDDQGGAPSAALAAEAAVDYFLRLRDDELSS